MGWNAAGVQRPGPLSPEAHPEPSDRMAWNETGMGGVANASQLMIGCGFVHET